MMFPSGLLQVIGGKRSGRIDIGFGPVRIQIPKASATS